MIKTKADLLFYLQEDNRKIGMKNAIIQRLSFSAIFYVYIFFKHLRYVEYYKNHKKRTWEYIPYFWHLWRYRRLRLKTHIFLAPNVAGPGFHLVHPGYFRASEYVSIGKECTVLPMVLFGKKNPNVSVPDIIVGDNCYISTGVTILGPVNIGNNVTIGAGAVVTKDIPDNCVVAGIPAKVIKVK